MQTETQQQVAQQQPKLVSVGTLTQVASKAQLDANSITRDSLIVILTLKNGQESIAFLSKSLSAKIKKSEPISWADLQVSTSNGGQSFVLSSARELVDIDINFKTDIKPSQSVADIKKMLGFA
ncbi:MAG: hypothetical protein RLZZ479_978 [Bacteroidota bacterium]